MSDWVTLEVPPGAEQYPIVVPSNYCRRPLCGVIDRGEHLQLPVEMLAAYPRAPRKTTAEEVAEMLHKAKAPTPWQAPDGCRVIADCMMTPLSYQHTRKRPFGPKDKPDRNRLCRAQDAIDELRRVLPNIIRRWNDSLTDPTDPTESWWQGVEPPKARDCVGDLERLLALLKSLPPLTSRRYTPWWQLDAARLFELYRATVDASAGISEEGPAVRFVHEALKKMGYPARITPTGIDHALRRRALDWHDIATLQRWENPVFDSW
jgi:hypothetical protein